MRTKLWIACASFATCVRTRLRVRESAYLPADNCERDDGHASTNTKNAFYLQLLVPLVCTQVYNKTVESHHQRFSNTLNVRGKLIGRIHGEESSGQELARAGEHVRAHDGASAERGPVLRLHAGRDGRLSSHCAPLREERRPVQSFADLLAFSIPSQPRCCCLAHALLELRASA